MYTVNDILKVEKLKDLGDNTPVRGLILIKDYKRRQTKKGGYYLDGISEQVGSLPFKVWSNSNAFDKMLDSDYTGEIVYISGQTNLYGGTLSLTIDDIASADMTGSGIEEDDFFFSKYNGDALLKSLVVKMKKSVSEDTFKVFEMILTPIMDRFKREFAAKGHHDNCKSGLVAHTYKVLTLAKMIELYPEILRFEGDMDLLYLGCAIHDIGKVLEYTNGVVVGTGMIVSHHTLGVEMLFGLKDKIIEIKGEEFYYRLCAIIEQHHGEYEESPRTIEAYIIHKIDCFESQMQYLNQCLEGLNRGDQLMIENFQLC